MKSLFLSLVLVVSTAVAAYPQNLDKHSEKSKIIALENAWNQAQIHRDGEAFWISRMKRAPSFARTAARLRPVGSACARNASRDTPS